MFISEGRKTSKEVGAGKVASVPQWTVLRLDGDLNAVS